MDNRMLDVDVNGFRERVKRVDKRQARKAYAAGDVVFMLGCKTVPGYWYQPCPVSKHIYDHIGGTHFDQVVCNFEYYNCDSKRGYYPAYYVSVNK